MSQEFTEERRRALQVGVTPVYACLLAAMNAASPFGQYQHLRVGAYLPAVTTGT